MNNEIPKRKRVCAMCQCIRSKSEFGIRKYRISYKICNFCRSKVKCKHNRQRSYCKECEGGKGGKKSYIQRHFPVDFAITTSILLIAAFFPTVLDVTVC